MLNVGASGMWGWAFGHLDVGLGPEEDALADPILLARLVFDDKVVAFRSSHYSGVDDFHPVVVLIKPRSLERYRNFSLGSYRPQLHLVLVEDTCTEDNRFEPLRRKSDRPDIGGANHSPFTLVFPEVGLVQQCSLDDVYPIWIEEPENRTVLGVVDPIRE